MDELLSQESVIRYLAKLDLHEDFPDLKTIIHNIKLKFIDKVKSEVMHDISKLDVTNT